MRIAERRSPNCGPRRNGARPDMVVLHYTAMAGAAAAADRLCDPGAEVSAHYLVDADGAVLALVPEELRAWHAGASAWGGVTDVNSRSIGVELDNPGHHLGYPPFPEPQMAALEALLAGILVRWAIPPERVVGHACIAPGRKIDPGEKLDWRRLARRGLAVWLDEPPPGGASPSGPPPDGRTPDGLRSDGPQPDGRHPGKPAEAARFRRAARAFGYPVDRAEGWTGTLAAVWRSFAMRFRPRDARCGPHAAGIRHLEALAARWPVAPEPKPPRGKRREKA